MFQTASLLELLLCGTNRIVNSSLDITILTSSIQDSFATYPPYLYSSVPLLAFITHTSFINPPFWFVFESSIGWNLLKKTFPVFCYIGPCFLVDLIYMLIDWRAEEGVILWVREIINSTLKQNLRKILFLNWR